MNNAGVNTADHRVPIDEFPKAEWDRLLAVDLDGPYHVSKAVIPSMRTQQYGRIINISSIAGLVPLRLQSAFVAAKAGVVNLTKSMAIELGSAGILVNAVAPGSTLTDGTRQLFYGADGMFRESDAGAARSHPAGPPRRRGGDRPRRVVSGGAGEQLRKRPRPRRRRRLDRRLRAQLLT